MSEHRTPLAWQHRSQMMDSRFSSSGPSREYNTPSSSSRISVDKRRRIPIETAHGNRHGSRSTPTSRKNIGRYNRSHYSPSSTDGTFDETTETDDGDNFHRTIVARSGVPLSYNSLMIPSSGFLLPSNASHRSLPLFEHSSGTWDGQPCPIHHHHTHHPPIHQHHPHSLYGASSSRAPSIISGMTSIHRPSISMTENSKKGNSSSSRRGSRIVFSDIGAPLSLAPSRHYPKIFVGSPPPPHSPTKSKDSSLNCCSGHFIIVWIILGIITFGTLLGIALKFTIA